MLKWQCICPAFKSRSAQQWGFTVASPPLIHNAHLWGGGHDRAEHAGSGTFARCGSVVARQRCLELSSSEPPSLHTDAVVKNQSSPNTELLKAEGCHFSMLKLFILSQLNMLRGLLVSHSYVNGKNTWLYAMQTVLWLLAQHWVILGQNYVFLGEMKMGGVFENFYFFIFIICNTGPLNQSYRCQFYEMDSHQAE